jgi:hypothetical protein
MTVDAGRPAPATRTRAKRLARLAWALALGGVAVAILMPAATLGDLREAYPWLSRALSRLDRLWPAVDMVHVLLFAALGALTALAFPRRRLAGLAFALAVLAGASELAQFAVPGRTPRWAEFAVDIAAGWGALLVFRGLMLIVRGGRAPPA